MGTLRPMRRRWTNRRRRGRSGSSGGEVEETMARRRGHLLRVLFSALLVLPTITTQASAADGAAEKPIPDTLKEAIRKLKDAKGAEREATFALILKEGDARLIPLLEAFKIGMLEDREGRLVIYGAKTRFEGKDVYPLIDAFTGETLKEHAEKLPSSKTALAASRGERREISAIVSALSLNDPDPAKRRASIIEAGNRADVSLLPALKLQLEKEPPTAIANELKESIARIELVHRDPPTRRAAAKALGEIGSERAIASLQRARAAPDNQSDAELQAMINASTAAADRYQRAIKWIKITFDGLSLTSILILLALGLSIVFGLMGVINMAHGEFMMVGAFTTFVVSSWFKTATGAPGPWFDYYPLVAIPMAFMVSALVGLAAE